MRFATQLRSATTVNTQLGQDSYRGIVGNTKPNLYYRLRLNQRSSLNLSLSGLKTDANLALVDQNGKAISQSVRSGNRNKSIAQTVEPGTYYVRVQRHRGTTRYQLNIAVNAAEQTAALTQPAPAGNALADQVVALVNVQRSQAGLKPVRLNPLLSASAQAHSQDMALNDFFSHSGSNGSTAERRILATGYDSLTIGENIAAGFSTPESVMQAWMNSPEHRENILQPVLEEIGIGFYFLANDTGQTNYQYYWTQDFGTPMSSLK